MNFPKPRFETRKVTEVNARSYFHFVGEEIEAQGSSELPEPHSPSLAAGSQSLSQYSCLPIYPRRRIKQEHEITAEASGCQATSLKSSH